MTATFDGTLTWVGQSTFKIETGPGARVLLECFVDSCPTTPDALKGDGLGDLDLILLTHGHGDHIADVGAQQGRTGATVAGMVELIDWLGAQGIDDDKRIDFGLGGTIEHSGLRITMVPAQHSSSTPDGAYAGPAAGFVVELENGYRIYHAGDTTVFGDMALIRELYAPDLALLPIGGHYTMGPREAAKAVDLLGVEDVIGMHYGTFPPLTGTPAELAALVEPRGVRVHELEVGGRYTSAGVAAAAHA